MNPSPHQQLDPDTLIFERNLAAISRTSPSTARRVRETAAASIALHRAPDGGATGEYAGRRLASLHRPLEEGRTFATGTPVDKAAGFVVSGFGVGHHVGALAARLKRAGVIIVFEPDVALLRSVLERVDVVPYFETTNLVILTDEHDAGAIAAAVHGVEGLLAMGVTFVEHPASRARLRGSSEAFGRRFGEVMRAVRTTVMTTLVQVSTTVRNLLGNVESYARALPLRELAGVHTGRPAIVVAAGPSLRRNVRLLTRPEVRERFVVIAVQTVLKTLLGHGIRPDYVTALDYAELSKRFYEGLTSEDVAGIELVVEPKAHPSILESFPGVIRCPADRLLDDLLGPALSRDMGQLRAGATVAHMAYYLARYVGCDPVVLIGQDLGFTDGQYYYAGAAIHQVWSGELNGFNSLEMLEWERIVRSRSLLHRVTDVLGRPVYTDEQMTTYLAQFERDFLADSQAGRTVIDATEGGVAKRHTTTMTLADAVSRYGRPDSRSDAQRAPGAPPAPPAAQLAEQVSAVAAEVVEVERISRDTAKVLEQMRSRAGDTAKINALITDVYALRDEVMRHATGYKLVEFLNQTGVFNRFKADRAIEMEAGLTPAQVQQRQIERDITNVTWIADAAAEMSAMLGDARAKLSGDTRLTPRDAEGARAVRVSREGKRIGAIVLLDPVCGGLGIKRDVLSPAFEGSSLFSLTMDRLRRVRGLDEIAVLADESLPASALLEQERAGVKVIRRPAAEWRGRLSAVAAARAFARRAWRGGPGFMSVYDEVCAPRAHASVAAELRLDACLLLGADWSLFDTELASRAVERYRSSEFPLKFVFGHAAPGLCPCLVERTLIEEIASRTDGAGPFASLGALLGYIPVAPLADPIAKPCCITPSPAVRDLGERCIPDCVGSLRSLMPLLKRAARGETIDADRIAAELSHPFALGAPELVRIELAADDTAGPSWRRAHRSGRMHDALARLVIDRISGFGPSVAISFEGRGDTLAHPRWRDAVRHALDSDFSSVHVRTDLTGEPAACDELLGLGVPVVSVDLWADSPNTYLALTGRAGLEAAGASVRRMLAARAQRDGLPATWIVPRITRCDAVYSELESFYDHWRMEAGAAVIDPLPFTLPDQRIAPLPLPACVLERERRTVMRVRFDGSVAADPAEAAEGASVGNLTNTEAGELWSRLHTPGAMPHTLRAAS